MDIKEICKKMDSNINIPLILIAQLCSVKINYQSNKKTEKMNVLLIGGHGGGKSTQLNHIRSIFENHIRIEREGKFTPQGYIFNTIADLGEDVLISQIPEVGQNSNVDSYDCLKQLHDGEVIYSIKSEKKYEFKCPNLHLTACANKLDYRDADSQAVINRYVVLFLPNDALSSHKKVYCIPEEITDSEKNFLVSEVKRTIDTLDEHYFNSLDMEIIAKQALDLQNKRPNIEFLDGCRILKQYNTLVAIFSVLLKISLEEACVFTKELLLDNYKALEGYINKSKAPSKIKDDIYAYIDSRLIPFFKHKGSLKKDKIIELIRDVLDRKHTPQYIERKYYKGYKELYLKEDKEDKEKKTTIKKKGRRLKYFRHRDLLIS